MQLLLPRGPIEQLIGLSLATTTATEIAPDASDRILLPKRLVEYAGIEKEVVLSAVNDRVEIWSKERYDQMLNDEPDDFSDLAEEVMGDVDMTDPSVPTSPDRENHAE